MRRPAPGWMRSKNASCPGEIELGTLRKDSGAAGRDQRARGDDAGRTQSIGRQRFSGVVVFKNDGKTIRVLPARNPGHMPVSLPLECESQDPSQLRDRISHPETLSLTPSGHELRKACHEFHELHEIKFCFV